VAGWKLTSFSGHSKLAMILWTKSLQRRLNVDTSAPITVISVHPGGVDTFTHSWPFPRFFKWLVGLSISSPEVGAYNSVFAAAGSRIAQQKQVYEGAYLESQPTGRIAVPNKVALQEELGDNLWKITEGFLEKIGV
jgi:NAD(P)-dependent dehydrogenase (short-subunit alcohol dehydrogenase family)